MAKLVISGVIDGPLSGGLPKAVELTVLEDIADLSLYAIGTANNGGGTDGQEFTFPSGSATAGDVIYVASEATGFTAYFGFAPDHISSAMGINGDDAIELFENGTVIDVFGDIATDGTGQPWDYADGWAYRKDGTGPDGSSFAADNWTFSGVDALDDQTTNTSFPAGSYTATQQPLVINEFVGSTASSDIEFIELYGAPGASLAGLSLIVVESDEGSGNGTIDKQFDLDGSAVIGDNGFYLVGNDLVAGQYGVTPNALFEQNFIENSSYTLALVETATLSGGTVTGAETVIDAFGVSDGEADESFFFDAPVYGPDGSFLPAGLTRTEDGSTAVAFADFNNTGNTPTAGTFSTPVDPEDPYIDVQIHDIQGSTALGNLDQIGVADVSPLDGSDVRVQAVVTQLAGNGFFLQEEDADADADASTSEGIFVFSSETVAVGDLVTVEGMVDEYFGETQISADSVTVDASGQALPTAAVVAFPTATVLDTGDGYVANLEAYEGMLVTIAQDMTVTEFFNLDRFGEFKVSAEGRLYQFTQQNTPDATGFEAHMQDVAARTLTIDDGQTVQNPDQIRVPDLGEDGILNAGDVFRMGDSYAGLTGALDYDFGAFRLQSPDGTLTANNPRPEDAPADDGFRVASFNVLNFFTTLDEFPSVGEGSGPGGLSPRGADANPQAARDGVAATDEYDRQKEKLVQAIVSMEADVLGLVELENDFATGGAAPTGTGTIIGSGVAIQELVDAVNAALGATIYDWVRPVTGEFVGSDAIATGFIYDMTTTALVGDSAVLDTEAFIDPNDTTDGGRNRAALAQTFEDIETGEQFTAAVNHFKSKGSSGLSAGDSTNPDSDQGDGQGFWNDTRTKAAVELSNWLATNPTGSADTDILILGDLNAYAQEDPITALVDAGYIDLTQEFIGSDAYSFVFDGQAGTLDYAMSSASLTEKVSSVAEWHINADEPDALDYNLDFNRDPSLFEGDSAHRNSDHDPVIVTFDFTDDTPDVWTLELLHIADQEGSTSSIINAPNLSAVMNALDAQDLGDDGIADNTVRLSSGDAFIPGVFFDASEEVFGAGGVADILIQNELGLQAVAFGNHEFDKGTGILAGLIAGDNGGTDLTGGDYGGTLFPYLSANIDFSTDSNMAPLEVAGGAAPQGGTVTSSTVLDVNGEALGVVGATTPTLPFISSPGDLTVSPADFDATPTPAQLDALAAEIQAEVDALIDANPGLNKVVLLAHMQRIGIEQALAERLEDVDIIVAGGSNTRRFDDNDRPRDGDSDQGQYPVLIDNAGGTQTAVVNTDGSYKYVGRLVLDFDADGNIIADSYDATVSGAYATDAQGVAELNAQGLVDAEVQQIADAIEGAIIAKEGNVFGISDVFLNGNRSGTFAEDDPDGVRTQETNLGNLTADANLAIAQGYDDSVMVSIKNGGGIRASIGETIVPPGGTEAVRRPNAELRDGDGNVVKPEGGISQNDIAATLAFNNGLTLLTLTHAELKATLENGVDSLPGVSGGFLQVSGVRFAFDEARPAGDRVVEAAIVDGNGDDVVLFVQDGALVGDPDATVRIVTLNFLANGGDQTFDNLTDAQRVDLLDLDADGSEDESFTGVATFAADGSEQDALAEYLAANHGDEDDAFDQEDTGPGEDGRILNLGYENRLYADAEGTQILRAGAGDDWLLGGLGNDVLDGGTGFDTADYNLLQGNGGIKAFMQRDVVFGAGFRDKVIDVEAIHGTQQRDIVVGDATTQEIVTRGGNDLIRMKGDSNAELWAGTGDDKVFGGNGNEVIYAQADDDLVIARGGDDTADLGTGDDVGRMGDGDDHAQGGADNDRLFGNAGDDLLEGGDGEDRLDGGRNADTLIGGDGDDALRGGNGRDVLIGGAGDDTLYGGSDALGDGAVDTFVFATGDTGIDRIKDFEDGKDVLDLSALGFTDFAQVLGVTDMVGDNLRIDLGGGNRVVIEDFDLAQFDATDLILSDTPLV